MGLIVLPQTIAAAYDSPRLKPRPLSRSLGRQLTALCGAVSPLRKDLIVAWPVPEAEAPADLDALKRQSACTNSGQWVEVSAAHSLGTIWGPAAANWLFRAWHDSLHLELDAPFDGPGERAVNRLGLRRVTGQAERAILDADVRGQLVYFERHGFFPARQRAFVVECVRFGVDRAVGRHPAFGGQPAEERGRGSADDGGSR